MGNQPDHCLTKRIAVDLSSDNANSDTYVTEVRALPKSLPGMDPKDNAVIHTSRSKIAATAPLNL